MLNPSETNEVIQICLREGLIQKESDDGFVISDLGVQVGRLLFILSLREVTFDLEMAQLFTLNAETEALTYYRDILSINEEDNN